MVPGANASMAVVEGAKYAEGRSVECVNDIMKQCRSARLLLAWTVNYKPCVQSSKRLLLSRAASSE